MPIQHIAALTFKYQNFIQGYNNPGSILVMKNYSLSKVANQANLKTRLGNVKHVVLVSTSQNLEKARINRRTAVFY
jgi:hypothetical protein